jgi:hypothetical protein
MDHGLANREERLAMSVHMLTRGSAQGDGWP